MKKFLAILAVLAVALFSSVAFAEVTVSGSVDIRSLSHNNTTDASSATEDSVRNTQERIRLNVDAKHEGVKAKVTIENDWDVWGRIERPQANGQTSTAANANTGAGRLAIREGWIDFNLPFGWPGHIKVGHQFLQLGNGWYFRSNKYGSDAWVLGFPGKNTFAFVDVKASEGTNGASDDTDAYVLLDTYKIDDNNTVGAYFVRTHDPQGKGLYSMVTGTTVGLPGGAEADLDTIGLHYSGKVGPVKLMAELDFQMGSYDVPGGSTDFSGNQIILQAAMPIDALTINATLAMGSGDDESTGNEIEQIITALDADPHYTFVYEYFAPTAAGAKNTGFANTTALGLGASYKISKAFTVALDLWMLTATETAAGQDDAIGTEIDAKILWTLNDNLTWNWTMGRLMYGDFYGPDPDDADAIQGILSYKF